MSERFPGGFITKSPVAPTTSAASGIWTVDQQEQYQQAGTWPQQPVYYIEDMFSTYLYTGNGSTQTINNGIDLSTYGGLTWLKNRTSAGSHLLFDTARGADNLLQTNQTNAQIASVGYMTTFNANGFGLASSFVSNNSGNNYASWTFRKQAKFFDVVTWTGNGTTPRVISHNLGSVPGCIIAKRTDNTGDWYVYHRSLNGGTNPEQYWTLLNTTGATQGPGSIWGTTAPTSTGFNVGAQLNTLPGSGITPTYVAYVFAHNAGGFGLTGTDNVILCGSFAGGTNVTVTLDYEPQWLLVKKINAAQNWFLVDNMRGFDANQDDMALSPNLSNAEPTASGNFKITSTGFINAGLGAGTDTYIYIAIRRGPMKVPTSGTSVFSPVRQTGGGTVTTGFPVDMTIVTPPSVTNDKRVVDRLRGNNSDSYYLSTNLTNAEAHYGSPYAFHYDNNMGFSDTLYNSSLVDLYLNFRRAPSFFDEVCFTSAGVTATFNHNLGVTPELMIVKQRNSASDWYVWSKSAPSSSQILYLDATLAWDSSPTIFDSTAPTASVFTFGNGLGSGNFVNYLFASCPGVSKVGSYTGTGSTQTISCGFTGGARFVLIKRTDSTGDWYVWDTARGMVSGTDSSLLLNSTAAEVNANSIYTTTGGFQIVSTAAGINASGGSYIYLAIA